MEYKGKYNNGDSLLSEDDIRQLLESEMTEEFLPRTGGELTGDLWLHKGGSTYGSRLIFGDKGNGTPYTYIGEDAEDFLVIHGYEGVKIESYDSVIISGTYGINLETDDALMLRGLGSVQMRTNGIVTLFGDQGIKILTDSYSDEAASDIVIGGNIIPQFNNKYNIGKANQYIKSMYCNYFLSGAAGNNLNLIGGDTSTYGIRFRLSDFASTPVYTELGKWTSDGLTVNGKLTVNGVDILAKLNELESKI